MSAIRIDSLALTQLGVQDPKLAGYIRSELRRQQESLVLIPSENYASPAVLEAAGTVLTNKYAEGYPGRRYYHGTRWCDAVETLAIDRAKRLFGCDHANVQPHAGAQANFAVYLAFLKPGDTVLGMGLDCGGHLTHGQRLNYSGRWFNIVSYGVDRESGRIDYAEVERLADQHKPKMIIAGFSSYMFQLDFARFGAIAKRVGAVLMSDIAHIAGLVVAKLHPDPLPHSTIVTTTTHKTLRGPRGGLILCGGEHAAAIDRAVLPGTQGGPLMHIIAAKAVAFKEAQAAPFRRYQACILRNASVMAATLASRGLRVVGGKTENHLMVVDLTAQGLTGKDAATLLEEANLVVNMQVIPYDQRPPQVTSGIRLGSPAVTTRGLGETEVRQVAEWIAEILKRPGEPRLRRAIRAKVVKLAKAFPIY
ncbi:MAG: serine hydroxymethyltransferase [Candidatus Coatesbacteria bacterium]